ncbi:MAG: TetR/AcrR family transcriptional regulator [Actinobacteria bacterium]|nr:TetR/AcrR family transcriptional regulator [Actinomycetota bacterium]
MRFTESMKPGGASDRDATTRALVDSALEELRAFGQADFAMERVARGAFYSVGSVYERWPDRNALLADLGIDPIASSITEALASAEDATVAIEWALGAGRPTILLGGEILLAGHTSPSVRGALRVAQPPPAAF